MSEDEGPDSDSSGREFRRRIMRPRIRRSKEARVCYSSRTTMSLQDPMPEYVDPELVKLIAQNAPFELDVFMRSLHKNSTKRRAESDGRRDGAAKEGERRPLAVEALLSSMRERNDHSSIRKGGQDIRHSCPEGIWSDYDETDENICRATAVKRKRPKSVDSSRLPPSDRQCPSEVSFRVSDNTGRGKLRRASVSTNSSDEGSNCLEDECRPPVKTDTFDVSSTPPRLPVGNDCDMLSAKPWRHGMRKGKRSAKDERQPNASCCKRKAETDSRKTSEVRKYMETKMVERRKEQQQLKAEAGAALAARKERQRKLDLHQQSMFQSQGAGAKSRGHSPRPAWVFEYTSLCEPPRPWSSSSGELNTYLPPPVTPPNLEPVPLDLYATQLQFAEVRSSKVDGIQVQNAHARENRRSKKARGCSREVQRQLKYGRSRMMKEFPHTDLELAKLVNSPVSRKARWKAKTKLRERKVSSEEVFQRQLFDHDEPYSQRRSGDLEVYKRSLKRQFYSNGGSLCTAAKELQPQKSTSKFSTKTATKPMRPAESSLKSVIKDQARPGTKVKRLKATEHFIPGKVKELTGEELASLLNANRVPSDCERETNVTLNGQVIVERMIVGPSQTSPASEQESITDLRKCVDHSLGSPQKNSTDEDVLCKWFGPSVESSEQHVIGQDVLRENTGQMLGSSFKPSKNNRAQLQVLDVKKEKTGETDIVSATRKDPTMVVRWQRMQLLKNLAEQLVKRVDEACAKKRQIELSAVEQINSPSMDINIEPSGQPTAESGHKADSLEPKLQVDQQSSLNNGLPSIHLAGSLLSEKFQDSEPKFVRQSKENNIINYRGLTEQEQAGFVSRSVKSDEMKSKTKKVITSPRRASITEAADYKAVGGPMSEICTMMEWTTSDKCTDITFNNTSASSSFRPSSPLTASSSPVVLPTSTKYHMRRIKHSKMVSREAKTRQPKKEDWIIPAENDTHSIFNVYTQHLKDREKLAASTLSPILQNDLDNSATDETEIDPGIAGPAAEVDISNVSSTPLSRKFTVSESLLKLPEPMNVQRTRSAECSHESTESPVSDGTGPDLQKKHNVSSPNFGSLQKRESRADKSAVVPPPDLTNLKTNAIELAGLDPEWTILEIGDLKVCQSPTSIHLRLDRCQDNGEDRKAKEKKFVNISHGPNVGNCTEASTNTSVGSKQETGGQCMRNLISPMKVTYARRVHSRARPDDGCTDDERVVVEWHQMNGEVPPVASQGDTKLDASEQSPTGLTCPRQNKVIGNAQSEIVETRAVKHILVNEEDSKEAYLCNKAKANGASEPIIDCASEKKLQACDGETGALCTMPICQKRELSIQLNRNSKLDPQLEFRDSEEWELKLRRNQLEAELKKLDAEIMKTRAKLHQRQPMIDSQAHRVSSISLTDHPVEGAFKLDKISNIQKRFAKYMAINDKHNDVFEKSDELQMQTIPDTHFSLKSIKDGEKTVTTSNSYSDSFISEETEVGQKILGTGKRDCLVDHLRSTENIDVYGGSLRELKTGIQQFETVLENRPQGSQSNASKKQAEFQSNCKMPRTQDEFASEGSEISTGRGPGRKLDRPPEVDYDESTAPCKISIVGPVPDQMVETDVGATRLCAKDERTTLQCQTVCSSDGLLDAVHNLVNAEEKSGRGPWVPLPCIPQQTEDMVIRKNKGQTCFRQKGRKAQELAEYGAGESPSSVVQCGAQNSDHSKGLIPGGRDDMLAVTAGVEILPGNRTSPCIQQNGRPLKGEKGNATTCDLVEVPRGPIDEQTEGRISHAAVPSTLLWSARTSKDGSERVPSIELSKLTQKIQDELASRKQTLASFQNTETLLLAEDSFRMVTTEGLPFPLPPLGESEEYIPLVPSLHHSMQISHTPVELPAEKRFQSNTGLSNEENGQMTVNDGGNHPTCSHEGKMRDKAATTVPQFVHAACLTPLNIPCGSTAQEAPWECLSLPSHMDFSTIREKLRNNKIATDEHPITDGWSDNSQNKSFDSPTSTTGGESSGGHTLVSESIMTSDVPLNSKDFPEISSLELEQAAKGKCSPEMDATQENSFLTLLSRPEITNIKTDPSNHFIGTQGLITPVCSTRELPSFLPSLYFHQQTTKTNVSEEVDSIISEDIEHYESDVEEESQDDVEGPASAKFGTTCTSPPPSNGFTSPTPDSGYCVGDRSLDVQVFHPESGLSVTNGPTYIIDHVHKCNLSDCIDQDLTGEVPCWASGMGSPPTLSPRCPESPLSLHAGGQKKSLASTCASPESSGGKAVGCMQSVRATRAEYSSLQGNSRISDNYYCGSEVSESHHQSESISEELPSVDSEIFSNGSGPARENIHSIESVELNNREDINEFGTRDDGTNLHGNAMACSAPSNPDFMHNTDKQHPGSIGDILTAAGIAKQNPDMNFLYTSCVVTANFQETARSEDNSRCHPVQFASHHESETSKPVELPLSIVLPPLRPSKQFKQYDGTHFSDTLRIGKLSTKETYFEETLSNNEEHLSTKMSELQLESAHTEALTGTLSAASLAPMSSPGVLVKTLHNIFRCEQNNPGTVCTLDVARVEGYENPVPKILDLEVICLSPHQVGPLQVSDANFSVDPAKKVDCNSEDSLIEELEEFGQLRSETYNSSKKFTDGDSSLGNQNINMGDEVIVSAIAVPSLNISGYAGLALEKVPHQDDERLIVSIQLDCASLCAPTCRANDTPDSCFYLTSMGNENQPLGERRITKIESNKSFYSFNGEKSIGGPPTSMHLMMRANRDISSLPKTEEGDGPQNISLRPDQIISLQSCQASTFSRPSPLFGHQKIVTDLDKDAENHAQDKAENGQVNLQYTKTNAEFEGHTDQPYSDACSLQVSQTNLPAQHDSISDSNCSNKEGFLSQSLEQVSRNGLSGGVFEATVAVDLEACSSESCSSDRSSLIFMEEKEEVRCCEILEGIGKSGSYQVSCSGTFKDQMQSTTCLTPPHEASICANASPKLDVRMQKDVNRAEKLDIMTDLVTSLIYEDLLSEELSGLHQEVERTPTSPQISSQTIQTANVTKTVNSKSKRSRKVSEFCQVLKHFLPTGWRSASIRHKKGLFLHVEGLRPYPLNPASKTMPGTLELNVQYPNYRESEHFPKTANTQFLLLDVNNVYSYVQRSFELSSLILDRSPANWYDLRMPVGEDSFSALESQFWETGHTFGNNRWQMHKKLILDLINETLLKQFATKLLVPSFGMNTLALPAGGENLVQFVTKEIVEHERYASKRGFDIEKVIAKAFEDEHWEKCSEEARDVVGDLAEGILCDLIERFVYEMVRGWGSRINQCQVLAS